jgi:hypothetical protein
VNAIGDGTRRDVGDQTAPNGADMAAFAGAGVGALAMGVVVIINEIGLYSAPALYAPAGGVTGRTAIAAVVWLIAWAVLHRRWNHQRVDARRTRSITLTLVSIGLLLTFPPVWGVVG